MTRLTPAGLRRHLIELQTLSAPVSDGEGGFTQAPATFATVLASIEPATVHDLERLAAGTAIATASHVVKIPYVAGVTTQTQILFGSRRFYVQGVQNPDERNIELVLLCNEVVT